MVGRRAARNLTFHKLNGQKTRKPTLPSGGRGHHNEREADNYSRPLHIIVLPPLGTPSADSDLSFLLEVIDLSAVEEPGPERADAMRLVEALIGPSGMVKVTSPRCARGYYGRPLVHVMMWPVDAVYGSCLGSLHHGHP